MSGTVISDDAEVIRRLAIAGEGIAYKSWLDVAQDVLKGNLELLLPEYQGESLPLSLVCPHRRQLSPAVQQLYDRVKTACLKLQQAYPSRAAT